jgi:hypothetical protein
MVCRDLLPFSIVTGKGFLQFCINRGIVTNNDQMPSPHTISGTALDDVYEYTLNKIKNKIDMLPKIFSTIYDLWTDQHAKMPYIDVSIQFLDDSFKMCNIDLALELFDHPHTAVAIANRISMIMNRYEINGKFWTVTDNASNVKNAAVLMQKCIGACFCLDHSIHLILMSDLLINGHFHSLKNTVKKVKDTHKKLAYKKHEMKKNLKTK